MAPSRRRKATNNARHIPIDVDDGNDDDNHVSDFEVEEDDREDEEEDYEEEAGRGSGNGVRGRGGRSSGKANGKVLRFFLFFPECIGCSKRKIFSMHNGR